MFMPPKAIDAIQALNPYQPGKPVAELERELGISSAIKLASNENPWGCSHIALAAVKKTLNEISLYPDANAYYLKQALANKFNLSTQQLTIGNGSNDILDLLARTFLSVGDEAIYSQYAFLVYPLIVQSVGATARVAKAFAADNAQAYGHDLAAMLALVSAKTKIIFLANPNNPTGTWFDKKALDSFIKQVPASIVIVLDQAYCEYVNEVAYPNGLDYLTDHENVVVTRTFSKIYGLASLRIGYAISHERICDMLNRVRQPFNGNALGLSAAQASLSDAAFVAKCQQNNMLALNDFTAYLTSKGLGYIPSIANFITVNFASHANAIYHKLLTQGVIVRPVSNYGLHQFLRISMGTKAEMERLKSALNLALKANHD